MTCTDCHKGYRAQAANSLDVIRALCSQASFSPSADASSMNPSWSAERAATLRPLVGRRCRRTRRLGRDHPYRIAAPASFAGSAAA
jgi:hypothetical protein